MATWLIIGFIVHKYYLLKDGKKLYKQYEFGEFSLKQYYLGFILTLFLWPIAIFNNEFKK